MTPRSPRCGATRQPHAGVDSDTLAAWADKGFSADDARAWLDAAPGRFTPWTARQWAAEGFWPHDAAVWSEAFADPHAARVQRALGYGPFDHDEVC